MGGRGFPEALSRGRAVAAAAAAGAPPETAGCAPLPSPWWPWWPWWRRIFRRLAVAFFLRQSDVLPSRSRRLGVARHVFSLAAPICFRFPAFLPAEQWITRSVSEGSGQPDDGEPDKRIVRPDRGPRTIGSSPCCDDKVGQALFSPTGTVSRAMPTKPGAGRTVGRICAWSNRVNRPRAPSRRLHAPVPKAPAGLRALLDELGDRTT